MIFEPWELKDLQLPNWVGLTSGCFDLLHYYHLRYLNRCSEKCDYLIVGVDADDMVSLNKESRPIIPQDHRAAMVEALHCVDAVFVMWSLDDLDLVGQSTNVMFKNDVSIYGGEVRVPKGNELHLVPDVREAYSSTDLKRRIVKYWPSTEEDASNEHHS